MTTAIDWLLEGDPAIRWQVMHDLLDAPDQAAAERVRVATEGWGAQLLGLQGADGHWAGGACFPADFGFDFSQGQPWTATMPTLALLRRLGVNPADPAVQLAVDRVREGCRWEHDGQRFFDGEVEPCINGQTLAVGAYFGVDVDGIAERLLGEQLQDGGWNCEAERGSVRSSFHTTICVLEGLLEHGDQSALRRGEDYLVERSLLRRASTGDVIDPQWLALSFPPQWHYDVLRALDHLRAAGWSRDPRLEEPLAAVRSKQQPDGTWLLEHRHPGAEHFSMERVGEPSRWNTLRALRVLRWFDGDA